MSALLRLYPRAWRERYGEEMAVLLETRSQGPRDGVDLLFGAIDAHARGRAGRRWTDDRPETLTVGRSHPVILLLMLVAGLMAAYACLTSVIALAAPDPDRWVGPGPAGLALGAGLVLVGILGARRWPRAAVIVGITGGCIAAAAAPWIAPIALLLGFAPVLPGVAARRR